MLPSFINRKRGAKIGAGRTVTIQVRRTYDVEHVGPVSPRPSSPRPGSPSSSASSSAGRSPRPSSPTTSPRPSSPSTASSSSARPFSPSLSPSFSRRGVSSAASSSTARPTSPRFTVSKNAAVWKEADPDFYEIKITEDKLRQTFAKGGNADPLVSLIEIDTKKQMTLSEEIAKSREVNLDRLKELKKGTEDGQSKTAKDYPYNQYITFREPMEQEGLIENYEDVFAKIDELPSQLRKHVVLAGGAVLNFICGRYDSTDFDLFIVGTNDPELVVREIMLLWEKDIVHAFRTEHSLSFKMIIEGEKVPIQIILRSYKSPAEVVTGFDLDASGCCYYMGKTYCTPRAVYSIASMTLFVDIDRMSTTYNARLIKYAAQKGFTIFIPVAVDFEDYQKAKELRKSKASRFFCPKLNDSLIGLLTLKLRYSVGKKKCPTEKWVNLLDYSPLTEEELEALENAKASRREGDKIGDVEVIESMYKVNKLYIKNNEILGYGFDTEHRDILDIMTFKDPIVSKKLTIVVPEQATFLKVNPGTQFTASFHPIDMDWEEWTRAEIFSPQYKREIAAYEKKAKDRLAAQKAARGASEGDDLSRWAEMQRAARTTASSSSQDESNSWAQKRGISRR